MVSINQLVDIVSEAAGKKVGIEHIDGPMGVRGRNSDNSLCRKVLGWEPPTTLAQGLKPTYDWIAKQVQNSELKSASQQDASAVGAQSAGVKAPAQPSH
jgi:dTDP-D-glucose 4,6-dehydratase